MIDVLLKFPSYEVAGQVGLALGFTDQNPDGSMKTTQATESLAICVIGEHFYPNGQTTTNDDGMVYPVRVGDGNWWVMVRSLIDIPIPEEIKIFVVQPDPDDPLIPNRQWA